MAKKGNLGKKRKRDVIERPVRFRRYGHLFLIVCEDENTEPAYFRQFIDSFPDETLYLKPVGTGLDPKGVVERAVREKEALASFARKEVDYVWVVFDKDDADWNETRVERFKEAFNIAKEQKFRIAYSNEVFELWLLLHLREVDSAIPLPRQQVYNEIQLQLRLHQNFNGFRYVHGNADVIEAIKAAGDENAAIERANALFDRSWATCSN